MQTDRRKFNLSKIFACKHIIPIMNFCQNQGKNNKAALIRKQGSESLSGCLSNLINIKIDILNKLLMFIDMGSLKNGYANHIRVLFFIQL
jgi:hypothetical protein